MSCTLYLHSYICTCLNKETNNRLLCLASYILIYLFLSRFNDIGSNHFWNSIIQKGSRFVGCWPLYYYIVYTNIYNSKYIRFTNILSGQMFFVVLWILLLIMCRAAAGLFIFISMAVFSVSVSRFLSLFFYPQW